MTAVIDGSGQTTGGLINAGTAQASTSGTSITFTGIPSTAKRITVLLNGVSTSGTSNYLIQVGAGSVTSSGYASNASYVNDSANSCTGASSTAGFLIASDVSAAGVYSGICTIALLASNTWIASGTLNRNSSGAGFFAGNIALGGTLDRVVITTVNGTDTFDAGSINIFWE